VIPTLFSIREAAVQLQISEPSLRRLVAARQIGHTRTGPRGGAIRFAQSDLDEFVAARHVAREPPVTREKAAPPDDEPLDFGFGPIPRRYSS